MQIIKTLICYVPMDPVYFSELLHIVIGLCLVLKRPLLT